MTCGDAADRVRGILDSTVDVPLPGSGATARRWALLREWSRDDTVVGRLLEAHFDADAIRAELDGARVVAGEVWGVWASESATPVTATLRDDGRWELTGRKMWCSGAHSSTHALVTAQSADVRHLFAVELDRATAVAEDDSWHAVGMRDSDSGAVTFTGCVASESGSAGQYISRAGFWHGAIGVAACWYGAALGVADPLYRRARSGAANPHALAHLGAVDAALVACAHAFDAAATEVDRHPDAVEDAHVRALRVRAIVERSATEVLDRVGRALGAGPLADANHAQRVADLTTYLRQSHAETDLENLGRAVALQAR